MSLINRLNDDMKQAMRVKDKEKLSVIRMVKASLQNEAIHLGVDTLEDDDELTILSRELKQRNDSLIEFKQAGRDDLVEKIEKEIEILQIYMPEQLTEDEIEAIIIQAIKDTNATSKKEFGKVMGTVMPKVKGKADGKIVQKLVQKHLK
ncbi:MAG TPA: GatB/YqeY domain-containing protein [Pseudogracilibacillus sp.]|nr:GatB/YqeY domain-containing protein [Pseudogracilibacillus sp.]